MNRNTLKWIALFSMTIDHIAFFLFPGASSIYIVARIIGRLAFPLFALLISEGFLYTRSFKKYFSNILIAAISFELILIIFSYLNIINITVFSSSGFNILWAFLVALLSLKIIYLKKYILYPLLIPLVTLAFFLPYSLYGFFIVILFALIKDNKIRGIIHSLILFFYIFYNAYFFQDIYIIQFFALFSFYFIAKYNNISKKSNKLFFYFYYPLHSIVLIIASLFI